jgi:hypothetical protein
MVACKGRNDSRIKENDMHGVPEQPESQPVQPPAEDADALPSPGLRIPKPDIEPPPVVPDIDRTKEAGPPH